MAALHRAYLSEGESGMWDDGDLKDERRLLGESGWVILRVKPQSSRQVAPATRQKFVHCESEPASHSEPFRRPRYSVPTPTALIPFGGLGFGTL